MLSRLKALPIHVKALFTALGALAVFVIQAIASLFIEHMAGDRVEAVAKAAKDVEPPVMSDAWHKLTDFWAWTDPVRSYLGPGFLIGFGLGALVFTAHEWPKAKQWLKHRKDEKTKNDRIKELKAQRDSEADRSLAIDCDKLAQELISVDAKNKVRTTKNHWADSGKGYKDSHSSWVKARESDARSAAKTRQQLGAEYLRILAQIQSREIDVEYFRAGLDIHNYGSIAAMLIHIAESLRKGDYYERKFEPPFHSPLGH